jgi:hypothetical protein
MARTAVAESLKPEDQIHYVVCGLCGGLLVILDHKGQEFRPTKDHTEIVGKTKKEGR